MNLWLARGWPLGDRLQSVFQHPPSVYALKGEPKEATEAPFPPQGRLKEAAAALRRQRTTAWRSAIPPPHARGQRFHAYPGRTRQGETPPRCFPLRIAPDRENLHSSLDGPGGRHLSARGGGANPTNESAAAGLAASL